MHFLPTAMLPLIGRELLTLRERFRWVSWVLLALLCSAWPSAETQAAPAVRIAVLAFRPKPQTLAQWQPLAKVLKAAIPERDFVVQAYTLDELNTVVAQRQTDFVLTNPGHYVLLTRRSGLQAPLATLLMNESDQETATFGGVMFTRAGQPGIATLQDVRGKSVAAVALDSLGGYQMQAYELLQAGVDLSHESALHLTGVPQDQVVAAVLSGQADVGFVRTGVLEAMVREGKLDKQSVQVIQAQKFPVFPVKFSTGLYPEWPLSYLGHVDERLARRVVATLFLIAPESDEARAMGINGFTVPADYTPVSNLLRALRMPPFDTMPSFTWRDVLQRYQWQVGTATVALLLIVLLSLRLWLVNLRLQAQGRQVLAQQATLDENDLRWKLAVQASGGGLWDWNIETHQLFRSEQMLHLLGYAAGELDDDPGEWELLLHPEDHDATLALVNDCLQGRVEVYEREHRVRYKDGSYKWFLARGQVVSRSASGEPLRMVGIDSDITERKTAERQLQLAASVFNAAREGIVFTDAQGNIIEVNQAFTAITGYLREEAIGRNPRMMNSGQQNEAFYAAMFDDLARNDYWSGEIWNRRKNGDLFAEMLTITAVRDAQGRLMHYVGLFSDITQIKAHQKQLEHIAHFDALTHLPNRVLLADRMQQAMAQATRRGQLMAVAYLDLDGFKAINDTYGHDVGDQLLIEVSSTMKQVLREGDTLARIGGDEFVAVLTDFADVTDCTKTIERVMHGAAQTMHCDKFDLQVSASLGLTFFPQSESVDADQLMRQADLAMYQAKVAGKNRFFVFDASQDRQARSRRERIDDMVLALKRQEFVLYYQPKLNLRTGQVVGAEALIRWQHPQKGLLSPAHFLPIIESHMFSVVLGDWVIQAALNQIAQWQAQGLNLAVSVNVNAAQLQCDDFVQKLRRALQQQPQVQPQMLTLEVLETSVINDLSRTGQLLADCARLGVAFSLDDFGTGYSSLTYLKHLPVKEIKIDQSFVRDMLEDDDDMAILQGVISLAHSFKREVIAEGMETAAHGARLLQLGCELAQGYGIARPMPAQEMPHWMSSWQTDPDWVQAGTASLF